LPALAKRIRTKRRDFKVWRARASGNCAGPLTRSFKVWRARRKLAGFS